MPEIISVASLPMKDLSAATAALKAQEGDLLSAATVKPQASFHGVVSDDPNRLEIATVWASEADAAAANETEQVKKFVTLLMSHEDPSKASDPDQKFTGLIIGSSSGQGTFMDVAASPIVHIGQYRVPASVSKADFETAWSALCAKAGKPPGAVAGPSHGWVKESLPGGDNMFVVSGGWSGKDAYEAVAKDSGHPAALPAIAGAEKGKGKLIVFTKTN